jgi:transcriptional regulator GlxA family with amidase domain
MTRKVLIVGFPGVQALDLVGPFEVFTSASLALAAKAKDGYQPMVASIDGQPVSTETGLVFAATKLPDPSEPVDTLVLPGGRGTRGGRRDPRLVDWIVAAAPQARRVVTVCTGAFLAAQAGLLDGCRATTHWAYANQLAREFPAINVDPDPIFVRSSPTVWTAAGVSAGIDLALALVEEDHGTEVAQTVARWLVLHLRRPGGQTQFAAPV